MARDQNRRGDTKRRLTNPSVRAGRAVESGNRGLSADYQGGACSVNALAAGTNGATRMED